MNQPPTDDFSQICAFPNLLLAWRKAAKGKRGGQAAAGFENGLADRLLNIQEVLLSGDYRPGTYTHFYIHEPKRRRISAAPFQDRVVHHALCNVIEPIFERRFIPDSYANRVGKGTHRACNRCQQFAARYRFVLPLDIVKHFPAIDHLVLLEILRQYLSDKQTLSLCARIIASGNGVLDQEYQPTFFEGDDLLDLCRARGLPIGNLTSQFWSNCYLHPLDLFIKRELGCKGYLRYVDDFCLFSDSKAQLWAWKREIRQRLCDLRLQFHEGKAQVMPTKQGVPWLGFVIYPDHRKVKRRKVVAASRRLAYRFAQWQQGEISFAEFDAVVQGWINHVRYADSWGMRQHMLKGFTW